MSIRQLIKQCTHFLVHYECDNKTQIRTRGFIRTEEEIKVDGTYVVQWGRKDEFDTAVVLAAGTEKEMKIEFRRLQSNDTPQRVEISKKAATKTRLPAKVIRVVSPSGFYPQTTVTLADTTVAVTTVQAPPTCHTGSTTITFPSTTAVTTVQAPPTCHTTTPTITVPSTTAHVEPPLDNVSQSTSTETQPARDSPNTPSTGFLYREGRPSGFGPLQSNLLSLEACIRSPASEVVSLQKMAEAERRHRVETEAKLRIMRSLLETIVQQNEEMKHSRQSVTPSKTTAPAPEWPEDIPDQYRLSMEELRSIHLQSSGPRNMVAHLVQRLCPELFGVTNLRQMYSWFGGGNLNKKELCPVRKGVIRSYVYMFYPEIQDERVWKEMVVPKVNELMRRITRQERKKKNDTNNHQDIQCPDTMMPDPFSFMSPVAQDFVSYMNL